MSKSSKSKTKSKAKTQLKAKQAAQSETRSSSITTKKSYWVMLSVVIVAVFSVVGYMLEFALVDLAALMFAIVFLIGLIGYIRVTPSNLSNSKRGTFLFVGISVIGFSIWAIIMLILTKAGKIETVFGERVFLLFPSLIICLIVGAFIGELMGRNSRIQHFFFKPKDDL